LCVDDRSRQAQVRGDVGLDFDVDVLRAVKVGRAARADAVGMEGLDGTLFDLLRRDEVVVVVGGEVGYSAIVAELDLGAGWSGRSRSISRGFQGRSLWLVGAYP